MKAWRWLLSFGVLCAPVAGCGPDHRPEEPCDGPSFWLTVRAETGPLPAGTRLNVRYGGNPEGELVELGHRRAPQAVNCEEVTTRGGTGSGGTATGDGGAESAGGAASGDGGEVWSLQCGLYTQGPARIDVTAQGYEPVEDLALSFEKNRHCEVEATVSLMPMKANGGT